MEEQKITSFFRFEDLRIYNKSLEYYNWLTVQAKQSDDFAKRVLFMPLLDATAKISINIAEGTSYNKSQFVNFLKDAKSTVRECVVFTTMAYQNGFFTQEQEEISRTTLIEMTKMLGAMIVSLQKPYNKKMNEDNSETNAVTDNTISARENSSELNLDFNY